MQEMLGEGLTAHLPPLPLEPAGDLPGRGLLGAVAAIADQQRAGPHQMDVAALDGAGGGPVPDRNAVALVEAHDGRHLADPLRAEHLRHQHAPGRHHVGIAGIDLIGQVRVRRGEMTRHPGALQRLHHLAVLPLGQLQIEGGAPAQRLLGHGIGRKPFEIIRFAQQHIGQQPIIAVGAMGQGQGIGHRARPVSDTGMKQ